jgi:hypothetical protein
MDNDMKRRAFLIGTAATLVAAPSALYYLRPGRKSRSQHHFTRELKRIQSLVRLPVEPMDTPGQARLVLAPPIGRTWNYVVFAPSHFPQGVSQALGDEPDVFLLREGKFTFRKTNQGQIVLTGRDQNSVICHPHQFEERTKHNISLLVQDHRLQLAGPKGKTTPANLDIQFLHLLTLQGIPREELIVGKKWKETTGRLRPFTGWSTQYEIAGFAEIAGRKTVNVQFTGSVPNIAQLPGVHAEKPPKDATMTNTHQGNAYFDLETGCLVRQEMEMTTVAGGLKGYVAKDGSKDFVVKTNTVIQLFPV